MQIDGAGVGHPCGAFTVDSADGQWSIFYGRL